MRALGIDLGSKRVGVAVSDGNGMVATPIEVIHRTGDRQAEHRKVAALVAEFEAEVVVVGMPYSLVGSVGPAAEAASAEVEELRATIGVPVETYDERLTTVTADRSLMEMKLTAAARRRMVDQVAAAVMLQAWLDHRRLAPPHPHEAS
jgi:putative Holliday junction resolvase